MANDFPVPFTVEDLPNPAQADPGDDLSAALFASLTGTLNYLHAAGHANVTVSQTFADSLCAWNTDVDQVAVCVWRSPVLSPGHSKITVEIRAQATVGVGHATFRIGGDSVEIAVPAGPSNYYTHAGSLTSGAGDGITDIITMDLRAAAGGGTVTVEHIRVSIDPLPSPLPAGAIDTFEPFGADTVAPDYCLPSHRGQQIISAIEALKQRPRSLMNWSGLDRVDAWKAAARQLMDDHTHTTFVPAIIGAAEAGVRYQCKALLHADPVEQTRFHVETSGSLVNAADNQILIPVAAGVGWYDLADDGEAGEAAELGEDTLPIDGMDGAPVRVRPAGARGLGLLDSTAGIASVSVWGP